MNQARTRIESEALARSPDEQREHERREVALHYEHHPEIFTLVLDRRLTYSTGIFEHPDEDLETAQARKLHRVRQALDIQPGERVLDAGCGWGSLLLDLAEHTEGTFHGVTLSGKQREVALERARALGIDARVCIDVCHVEDLDLGPASVDVVVFSGSIVHMHNREAIYALVGRILRPGGRLLVSDCFFPAQARGSRRSEATQYIFAHALGYCRLLQLSEELALIEGAGMDIVSVQDLTSSYVLTVGHWIDNVRKNRARIEAFAPGFSRLLQTYMTIARLSFARRTALEYLIVAVKDRGQVTRVVSRGGMGDPSPATR